jgi:hypothetical protein
VVQQSIQHSPREALRQAEVRLTLSEKSSAIVRDSHRFVNVQACGLGRQGQADVRTDHEGSGMQGQAVQQYQY